LVAQIAGDETDGRIGILRVVLHDLAACHLGFLLNCLARLHIFRLFVF
jgi:hypothetical protein